MQVYSQQQFAEDRDKQIRMIHTEAQDVHTLAGQMNEKIYEQEDKLGAITKDMEGTLKDTKSANQELEKAKVITAGRNKSLGMWTLFVVILALVLGLSIYFMFAR